MDDYRLSVYPIKTDKGIRWAADYPELCGCTGGGNTPEEAVREAEENKAEWLSVARKLGMKIPKPLYQ